MERFSDVDSSDGRGLIEYLDLVSRVSSGDKHKTFEAQNLAPGMRVLDAGCGTGDDVRAIARLVGDGGRVTGIDSSHAMIEEALRRGVPANAEFAVGSVYHLPFAEGAFDAIRAERVFQHLADPARAAAELARVLAPGGTLLLLDQDWESLSVAGSDRALTRRILDAFRSRLANPAAGALARGLLRRAGFEIVEVAPLIAMPALPLAFELILKSATEAALAAGAVDTATAAAWLSDLLQADARGEYYCAVVVVIAMGRRERSSEREPR